MSEKPQREYLECFECVLPESMVTCQKGRIRVKIPAKDLSEDEQNNFLKAVMLLYQENSDAARVEGEMNTTTMLMLKLKMCSKSMGVFAKYIVVSPVSTK